MTQDEFMRRMLEAFPEATVGEDLDGQIVVYTGLRESVRDGAVAIVPIAERNEREETTGERP